MSVWTTVVSRIESIFLNKYLKPKKVEMCLIDAVILYFLFFLKVLFFFPFKICFKVKNIGLA